MKASCFLAAATLCALAFIGTGKSDTVTEWNVAAIDAIRANHTTPPVASRQLALLHASIYDAVNGISRTHEPYYVLSAVPASASPEAAASAAAHRVLLHFYPERVAIFDALHATTLAAIQPHPQTHRGIAWGQAVASQILAGRAHDGWDATVLPPASSGPAAWVPTAPGFAPYLLPQWGFVTPFTMTDQRQFRPLGPPALNSNQYRDAYNEVKRLGAAVGATRTAEQTEIALFWADGPGTETPPGHWNSIARTVAAALGNTLEENARLFALLNLAMADAAICAWDAKYAYNFCRPITAIRNGDMDGNPETEADANWSPLIVTPPFPEYVSGHSTFSGAAAAVLARFCGTDAIAFTTGSDALPGVFRHFDRFSAAAAEAADSRLYGGIHFRFASEDGLAVGRAIGEWTFADTLRPKGTRSRN